jgi:NTE family protein
MALRRQTEPGCRLRLRARLLLGCGLLLVLLAGCASRPVNPPIAKADPSTGYRPYLLIPKREHNDPSTLFVLSFSGGGTRAAAFAFGVLEELRRTPIEVDGRPRRLLDEVDMIIGVSGGSFTALAYALHGDKLFAEYEQRFLKRDVQGELIARALSPRYWGEYIGGTSGRSELAADYYDEILFDGATYADLLGRPGPVALASSTDLSTGARLAFSQNDFDLLCTDLNRMRLSRAAATSSAVPVVLSPVTLNNYGGQCGYEPPLWVRSIADPDKLPRPSGRAIRRWGEMKSFQDSRNRPYIHLVDGGVSDNIGVRGVLEFLEEAAISAAYRGEVGLGGIRRIVLLVVDSHSTPRTDWDRIESPPGFLVQLLQASGLPIDRYSFETIETLKDWSQIMQWRRELAVAQARLAGASQAQAEAEVPKLTLEVIDVSFDAIRDTQQREQFMNLPTSFVLPPQEIDRLRDMAGQLMRESPAYQGLVRQMGGNSAAAAVSP